MRRLRLTTLFLLLNAGLLLLAVVCVALAAVHRLQRLADEQALARVELAGRSAGEVVARSGSDLETSARLLAERPTLRRLVQQGDAAGLDAFLERFRATSRLSACAVLQEGRRLAGAGTLPPGVAASPSWQLLAAPSPEGSSGLAIVAAMEVPAMVYVRVLVARRLDGAYARATGEQIGLPIALLDRAQALAAGGAARAVRERALVGGEIAAAKLDDGRYLAVVPLAARAGEAAPAVVEVTLSGAEIAASRDRLVRGLLFVAVLVAGFALLAGFAVARPLGRQLSALTAATGRIGRGDLETPLPPVGGGDEVDTLAAAMEEMRRRLLGLTAELRRRQAEAEAVLSGIAEGVLAVDRDRRVRYLNPQAARLLGVTPEQALGRFCGDLLQPRSADGTRPCDEHCPIVHARFRGAARAVEHLPLAQGAGAVGQERGRRAVVVASSAPAEERQFVVLRDETESEATRRLRDTVLANISHEFRTPLAAQLASIELLRDRLDTIGDPAARQLVTSLERGGLRLNQLIDNLLESVRIEAGEDRIRRRPVALDEVVEQAVETVAPLLEQRGQRTSVELPYPLPPVLGDAPRLVQVFVNLLANAHKFAPANSTIRLGGTVGDQTIRLWVEDEGPGLPAGGAPFARFARAPGEEPEESGMGLGLWIVQSIVERHGGRVEAVVGEGGSGTRMAVLLPITLAAADAAHGEVA